MSTTASGIYAIVHLRSGRVYIGSTANLSMRLSRHKRDLAAGIHSNEVLQEAWNAGSPQDFFFGIQELTTNLTEREQHWIDWFDACDPLRGFNLYSKARETHSKGRKRVSFRKPAGVASGGR